jgi:hypothetical protein
MSIRLEADDDDDIRQLAVKADNLLALYRHKETRTVALVEVKEGRGPVRQKRGQLTLSRRTNDTA